MLTIFCSMEKGVTCLKNNLTNFEHKNNNLIMQIADADIFNGGGGIYFKIL